jgi:hypothetical protein
MDGALVRDYPTALLNLIDQRIDQSLVRPTKMGTVQSRDSATALATVAFDGGSGIGQPVKCFESVVVDVGDRVGLIKFEGEWVIIGNYTARAFWGEQMNSFTGVGNTTSASFGDIPGTPRIQVTKYRDATQFEIFMALSMTSTVTATVVELAATLAYPDGLTTVDQVLFRRAINAATDHRDMSGGLTTPGLTLPGGAYSITGRWRRVSGTGTLATDGNDSCTLWAREVTV